MSIETKKIDGRALAEKIRSKAAEEIRSQKLDPGLGVILVGNDPASHLYVGLKEKACGEAGIRFEKFIFEEDAEQAEVISKIRELNSRNDINAILIQLPLPEHLDEDVIVSSMSPEKDVDGFHPDTKVVPGLAEGILLLARESGLELKNKSIKVIANSEVFAEPIYKIFLEDEAVRVDDPANADFLVVAVGKPGSIKPDMIKPGAVVIDVGTTRVGDRVVGDAADLSGVASAVTPVPGGVGPMTVAMLIKNTVKLSKKVLNNNH